MSRRASAAAGTRRRIIDATRALHTEQGIAATSWDAIAARAGVGVGTVYRHFPTLDDLVPACGEVAMAIVAFPAAAEAPARFAGLATPAERSARLVEVVFAIYERGAPELRVVLGEPGAHPSVAETLDAFEASLAALVDAADLGDPAVARAMIDIDTWSAFRRAGLDAAATVAAVTGLLSVSERSRRT